MSTPPMSEITTEGIRIGAAARYLTDQSDPQVGRYIFGYRILIVNESDRAVQLISRHWTIIDADGEVKHVHGRGVVGEQPRLAPGQAFKYTSFCPLATPWGTMEGNYVMQSDDGDRFHVSVARFYLTMEQTGEVIIAD